MCRWCKQPVRAMVRKGTGFCSAICRDAYLATCDMCRLNDMHCEGQDAHCANGQHCTTTTEVCALDMSHDDHPKTCEHCGTKLKGDLL